MRRAKLLTAPLVTIAASLALAGTAQAGAVGYAVDDMVNDTANAVPDTTCDAPGAAACTLREALLETNATPTDDTITFTVNGTLTLGSTLTITEPTTIDGNGPANTIIDGNDSVRLFSVNGDPATFKDMRLEDGGLVEPGTDGGAAIKAANPVTLNNAVVTSSQITGSGNPQGAGIFASNAAASVTLIGSTVSGNTISTTGMSATLGGGISALGSFSATDSTVSGNQINTFNGLGGGVFAARGFTITRSTLSGNSAGFTTGQGGALYNDVGNVGTREIVNSTISGNMAVAFAGGVLTQDATTVTNSTFADNSSSGTGRDLTHVNAGTVTVKNTILASTDACSGMIVPAMPGHNIDSGMSCGFGASNGNQQNTDPQLQALALNPPGTTATRALSPTSPALNAADPAAQCGASIITDQRGVSRIEGSGCDVGAFELEYRSFSVARTGSGSGSITSAPAGIDCPSDCFESVPHGAVITLTATPATGSSFTGWSQCDSPAGATCTQTLDDSETVIAGFMANPPPTGGGGTTTPATPAPPKCKKGQKLVKGKCRKKKKKKKKK